MTHAEQMDWLDQRQARDPYWSNEEQEIRRQALELAARINEEGPLKLATADPIRGGWKDITITPMRVGGYEQVLLIEEILRRARGLSAC